MGLLQMDRLIFSQKAKLIELTNEYAIRDEQGNQVGMVRQEGQGALKKVSRFISSLDQFMTHKMVAYDGDGTKVLELTRPAKLLRSRILVSDGAGQPVGEIAQQNVFGKIRFSFIGPVGETVGGINAENWRAWNFSIVDQAGTEIGRITKKWAGLGKELFTTADNYVFEISATVGGPLRLLALGSAVGVDLALKQDARGLG